jgi:glycosyltransferase involved in cell wall biosynthesis
MIPRLSAIIPTYNYAAYLKDAITSVLKQSIRDLELIVIDDGSTDNTVEVVESIKDQRLLYHFQDHQGVSAARNTGIRLSSGKYLAFLDADDIWLPQKSALQIREFEENPDIGLVYGSYELIDSGGNHLATRDVGINKANCLEKLICGNCIAGSASTSMINRDVFMKSGLFDPHLIAGEDWDMWLRIARYYEILGLKDVISCIRLHDKNSSSQAKMMDQGFQMVLDKFFNQPDLPFHLSKLEKKARSKAKIAAGLLAARREDYRLSLILSLQALRYQISLSDAYNLLFRSIFQLMI